MAKSDPQLALNIEGHELFLIDKNLAELKAARAKQAAKVERLMMKLKKKTFAGHLFTVSIECSTSMRFVGGMKKFIKRFGSDEARNWFKSYAYTSVKTSPKKR